MTTGLYKSTWPTKQDHQYQRSCRHSISTLSRKYLVCKRRGKMGENHAVKLSTTIILEICH